jgi:hypothetical protein
VESLTTLVDLLTRPDFLAGIVAGFAGLALLLLTPGPRRETVADWGLILSAGILLVVNLAITRRLGLVAGIGLLATGGWILTRAESVLKAVGWLVVALGAAVVVTRGGLTEQVWVRGLTAIVILAAGAALTAWARRLPQHLIGPMMAVSAFGIWATVPETEMARAMLGVAIPMALATVRPTEARLFPAGALAVSGLLAWVAASGGEARPASIIGGWACLGLLIILPFCRPNPADLAETRPWVVFGIHAVVVMLASRVIGLWESTLPAMIAAAFLAVCAFLLLGYMLGRTEESP